MNPTGKTAVITGAASGIGAGMAAAFAADGISLALLDVEEKALKEVADALPANSSVKTYVTDVSDRNAVKAAASAVADDFNTVHILCNNAGVGYAGVPLGQVPDQDWDWVLGVNLIGVVNGLQAFLPLIQAHNDGGHVVNTASIGGHHVMPGWGHGVYSTSKFAVVGLSEALADDLSHQGIGVSILCPAAVDTAIYEGGRNRPERFGGPFDREADHALVDMLKHGLDPVEVGRWVLRAVRDNQMYIFTHPHTWEFIARRHERLRSAFEWAASVAPEIERAAGEVK